MYKLTVIGSGPAGTAIAADLALKGNIQVNMFELEKFKNSIKPFQEHGGIEIMDNSKTTSGKTGFAKLNKMSTNPEEVIGEADVIMVAVPAMYHEYIFETISSYLKTGQIVLFNTGYWACLRIYKKYKDLIESKGIKIAESNIMPYLSGKFEPNKIMIYNYKRNIKVTTLPGKNSDKTVKYLKNYYTQFEAVPNVLYTNIIEGGNPCVHVEFSLPILGYMFDRYKGCKFYGEATLMGSRLTEAFDKEREKVAEKLGINKVEKALEWVTKVYGYKGKTFDEAFRKSEHADRYSSRAGIIRILNEDICYSFIPLVQMGKLLGVSTSVTKSMIDVVSVMLNEDYWGRGLTLEDMGLANLNKEEILSYVNKGVI
jgi:opine dehydrogenase